MNRLVLALLVLATSGTGCSTRPDGCAKFSGQTCISLELRSLTGVSLSVDQVALSAQQGFLFDQQNDFRTPGTPLTNPVALPIVVPILPGPSFVGGDFVFSVRGLLRGDEVGSAQVSDHVALNAHVQLSATLVATAFGDGGIDESVPVDGGDDGGPDMTLLPSPRPIAPVSTGYVTSNVPVFKWALAPGTDGARVEICMDRACTTAVQQFDVTGTSGSPPSALPSQLFYWRLHPSNAGVVDTSISSAMWEFTVGAPTTPTGKTSYGTMYDLNGDGFADLAYGAPGAPADAVGSAGPGITDIFLGAANAKTAWPTTPPAVAHGLLDPGGANQDGFGSVVISAGDLDGDGFADLAVSAPCAPYSSGCGPGKVYLYRGSATGLSALHPPPSATLVRPAGIAGDHFGKALAAGDLDGDGYSDLVVATSVHAVMIFRGGPNIFGPTAPNPDWTLSTVSGMFGAAVGVVGDLDADGFADLIVGEPDLTRVHVYRGGAANGFTTAGTPMSTLIAAPANISGLPAGSGFGTSIACAGDVNKDGYTDALIGAPTGASGNNGFAVLLLGSATGLKIAAGEPILLAPTASGFGDERFGQSLTSIGDFDHDGQSDIAVGGPFYTKDSMPNSIANGRVVVVKGPATFILGGTIAEGSKASDFGSQLKFVGDINGDGYDDLVIGTPAYGGAGTFMTLGYHRGRISIVFGAATVPAASDVTLLGPDGDSGTFGF